ncbi:MAG: substrate-binding domain-containing protein [Anaerovoracaceae bacterium]|nr:substrate-binding domain-containing protein [Bacillota bacterium]MDY3954293.1 substrate-binding domain-containing protein [Anaerovoracaceae bacterium]
MKQWSKLIVFVMVLLLSVFAVSGCGDREKAEDPSVQEEKGESLHFSPEEYPKVDGSTATIPFSEAVAAAVMDLPIEEARQYIVHNTTHNAYVNLINGDCDIIFVSPPSEEELQLAADSGVELDVIPMLRGGFVFFVNEDNPVENVKFQDIVDIYSGKITNWKQLGGENKKIIAYQRQENSGSQTGMLKLVMKDTPMMEAPREQMIGDMGTIIDAVALYDNDASAIGYSYYYYVKNMWGDEHIKLLAVDGIAPSDETIGNGTYPIVSTTYMVLRKDEPKDSNARKLADWILSDEGQSVAEEAGYVRLQ